MEENILKELKEYYAIWRRTNAIYEEWAKKYGMSYYEMLIVISLWEADAPCTQKQICEEWTLPKQTVNSILKNFERDGLITFETLKTDRRNKSILFTEAGLEFSNKIMGDLQRKESQVWRQLGKERRRAFLKTMDLYAELFENGE